ncbi:hypothetical protein ADK58_20410 [Streptomyces sp. XY152]|nr:hypothetical protein ADK58_20410 [Streptomyces sp. XY152]
MISSDGPSSRPCASAVLGGSSPIKGSSTGSPSWRGRPTRSVLSAAATRCSRARTRTSGRGRGGGITGRVGSRVSSPPGRNSGITARPSPGTATSSTAGDST